jgi:hypothetical protein
MIEFDKDEISKKTNSELLKDLFESNFHNENYITLVIEILQEKGINTSEIFKNMQTDDLVVSYCFDREKYKLPYILLVKEELLNRNYDISTIPDIKDSKTFSSSINGEVKKKKSNNNENSISDTFQRTFESENDTNSNSSKISNNYDESSTEFSNKESHRNKYIGISIAFLIVIVIKFGIKYGANELKINSKIKEEKQNQEIETVVFEENGIIDKQIVRLRHYLDSLKQEDKEFKLSPEIKKEFVTDEIERFEKILEGKNEKILQFKYRFIDTYKSKLEELLNLY